MMICTSIIITYMQAFRGALAELLNSQVDDVSDLTLTPVALLEGPGVIIGVHLASFYDAHGTAVVIMESNNQLIEDFVTLAVADGYSESLAGISITGVSGLDVRPTVEPSPAPTNSPSPQPSAFPTFQPSPVPTVLPSAIPTLQPTSQAMGITRDFTAAGFAAFTIFMFVYIFYNYCTGRGRRNGGRGPDSGSYVSLSEIEFVELEEGDNNKLPTSIVPASSYRLSSSVPKSTPRTKDKVKKKVADYIRAATEKVASPEKRKSISAVKPTGIE